MIRKENMRSSFSIENYSPLNVVPGQTKTDIHISIDESDEIDPYRIGIKVTINVTQGLNPYCQITGLAFSMILRLPSRLYQADILFLTKEAIHATGVHLNKFLLNDYDLTYNLPQLSDEEVLKLIYKTKWTPPN